MAERDADSDPRERKRQRILRAAIEVFASKGYFTARMTDVAHAADVADGTLYLYFDGKEHLLISIFNDVLTRFIEHVRRDTATLTDPREKLHRLIGMHLESLGEDPALAQVLQIETRHSRRFMSLLTRGRLGEYLSLVRDIIDEGKAAGCFRSDISSALATNLVFGAVDELVNGWLLADDPGSLTRHHDALVRLLFDGLNA